MLDPEFEPGLRNRESMEQEQDDTGEVIETAVTCLVLSSGAGMPFCTIEHLASYAQIDGRRLGPFRIGQSKARAAYCSHCYWCGTIIRRPERCVIHADQACPKWLWDRTELARQVLSEFLEIHGRPVTDDEVPRLIRFIAQHKEHTIREVVRKFEE